ncbi:MAG TPA: hypothetical protein VL131_06695 [Gammaproteobacteria bacterium]|nr:hypothetical protein [Gammaproteobacteria bacterium]
MRAKHAEGIRPVANLQEFFKDSVACAMEKQGVAADDHTAYYVVNLLTLFARADQVYDRRTDGPGPQPLALLLAEAASATDSQARNLVLQRVGDTALFVAGFFQDGFARKLVDVDYYIDMGGAAYGWLSESVRGTLRGRAFGGVFAELAEKFREFVDVLAEIRDSARAADDHDILRLYEVWLKTRSLRAARLLRSQGIEPNVSLDATTRH